MVQSAANWCNTHTHMDRTHSLTHLHQYSYDRPLCAKRQLSYYRIWNKKIFWRYLKEGEQTRVPREKLLTACPPISITYKRRKSNVPDGNRTRTLQQLMISSPDQHNTFSQHLSWSHSGTRQLSQHNTLSHHLFQNNKTIVTTKASAIPVSLLLLGFFVWGFFPSNPSTSLWGI